MDCIERIVQLKEDMMMKKLMIVIALLVFAGVASGQVYMIPSPIIVSVELVDGTIEVVYKRFNTVWQNFNPVDYEVWKDIYKAQPETGKIILWAKKEGRYIQPETIPERYAFDGELKLYNKSDETLIIDYDGNVGGDYQPNKKLNIFSSDSVLWKEYHFKSDSLIENVLENK